MILFLITAPGVMRSLQQPASIQEEISVMAVEHTDPLSLEILVSSLSDESIVDIESDARNSIYVSVPESWERREVRGAPINKTGPEEPMFGFRRWTLPAGAGISFRVPGNLQSMLLQNPSGIPVKAELTRIDVQTGETDKDIILVDDQAQRLF